MTSSIFFNWLLKSSSGNRLRATKLQNTFGCIIAHEKHICHAKNLLCLSSIFQFPMWVKPKASPNLVGSWESIKQNRQKAYWSSASLRSGLTLPGSLQAVQLASQLTGSESCTSLETGKKEKSDLTQAAAHPLIPHLAPEMYYSNNFSGKSYFSFCIVHLLLLFFRYTFFSP